MERLTRDTAGALSRVPGQCPDCCAGAGRAGRGKLGTNPASWGGAAAGVLKPRTPCTSEKPLVAGLAVRFIAARCSQPGTGSPAGGRGCGGRSPCAVRVRGVRCPRPERRWAPACGSPRSAGRRWPWRAARSWCSGPGPACGAPSRCPPALRPPLPPPIRYRGRVGAAGEAAGSGNARGVARGLSLGQHRPARLGPPRPRPRRSPAAPEAPWAAVGRGPGRGPSPLSCPAAPGPADIPGIPPSLRPCACAAGTPRASSASSSRRGLCCALQTPCSASFFPPALLSFALAPAALGKCAAPRFAG